eukprot:SAG31_NODE_6257_length_2100_cov_10.508246_1_plen_83_part_00
MGFSNFPSLGGCPGFLKTKGASDRECRLCTTFATAAAADAAHTKPELAALQQWIEADASRKTGLQKLKGWSSKPQLLPELQL